MQLLLFSYFHDNKAFLSLGMGMSIGLDIEQLCSAISPSEKRWVLMHILQLHQLETCCAK